MAPLPRPFLRFAVGTTLLVPVLGTGCDNDPPPTINTPGPEPAQPAEPKPVEAGDSGATPDSETPPPLTNPAPEPAPEPAELPKPVINTNTPEPDPEPLRPPVRPPPPT